VEVLANAPRGLRRCPEASCGREIEFAGLVKLYVAGGGNYARFWKYISPVFIGGLVIFWVDRGLTRFLVESRDASLYWWPLQVQAEYVRFL
jgi:hypothetical protein